MKSPSPKKFWTRSDANQGVLTFGSSPKTSENPPPAPTSSASSMTSSPPPPSTKPTSAGSDSAPRQIGQGNPFHYSLAPGETSRDGYALCSTFGCPYGGFFAKRFPDSAFHGACPVGCGAYVGVVFDRNRDRGRWERIARSREELSAAREQRQRSQKFASPFYDALAELREIEDEKKK